ncbi:Lar family restriction alleviation protein [Pseudoxanthomonas koreensis]|uniref:Lar family restriction alleviation protein n=1 Tax=Pseudoxanthomonas koreensis TaxID=266061 RepID=UPI001390C86E|nr:Lar family restriction alleviation protein [Pseudoxanthomonas koreensis]
MTPIERKARELLPCPFCGNADVGNDEGCFQTGGHWEVRCGNPSCFAHEPCGATYDEAVERWNRRAALTPPAGGLPEWQPIETAPRDVQVQLHKAGKQYVGQWALNPLTGEVAWSLGELGGGDRALIVGPTHWMPLPAAPSPKGDEP